MRQGWGGGLLVAAVLWSAGALAQGGAAQAALARQIAALTSEAGVARDHWGVMVTTLDGRVIYGMNEGQLFQPASNAKLFTTAAAMALLGADQRFTTRVEYSVTGKTIVGDLMLVGAGDANFGDRDLPYGAKAVKEYPSLHLLAGFADEIAAAGVTRVAGNVVGDDTVFAWEPYPQDWAVDDLVWGYGAPVSGLTVADNQMRLTIRPGRTAGAPGMVALQEGMPGYYQIESAGLMTGAAKTGNHVLIERAVGSKIVRVYGVIAVDAAADVEEIAIADPAEFAAMALRGMLEARGVVVEGRARAEHRLPEGEKGFLEASREALPGLLPPRGSDFIGILEEEKATCTKACPVVGQHISPTVAEDVVLTNKTSQNLHAELLLRHLGKAYGTGSETAQGVRVVRQFLVNAGLEKDDFAFYDGSGLSGHDLVTPRAVAKLLAYAVGQPWFAAWKASLPVGGVDGSLAGRFKEEPLKGRVFAKTGTLGEARALSGYLECASGKTVIFSVMVGNHLPGTSGDREVMDRIVGAIEGAN